MSAVSDMNANVVSDTNSLQYLGTKRHLYMCIFIIYANLTPTNIASGLSSGLSRTGHALLNKKKTFRHRLVLRVEV